jgi:hypothetical protein
LCGVLVEKLRWKLHPNSSVPIVQLQAARRDVEVCHMVSTPEELDDDVDHLQRAVSVARDSRTTTTLIWPG